jgi:hypothetical protein
MLITSGDYFGTLVFKMVMTGYDFLPVKTLTIIKICVPFFMSP